MPVNWDIETYQSLPSTMDTAHAKAQSGAGEGLVIVAREQNSARGRHGNSWIAPPGNLYFSLILRSIVLKDVGQYSFVAAVALADMIIPNLKPGFQYLNKWPNDGLINNKKLAGILLETGDNYLNIGIGVNITSAPPEKISLNEAATQVWSSDEFLSLYLQNLNDNIGLYRQEGFPPIRRKWLEHAKGLNEPIKARLPNESFKGIFRGLDENGALLLGLDNGTQKVIHSGEVFFGKDI